MWSCKLRPTPGSGAATSMPVRPQFSGSPIPDSISNCGELMTPPARMTSRSALTICAPSRRYSTPVARGPSNRIRVRERAGLDGQIAPLNAGRR